MKLIGRKRIETSEPVVNAENVLQILAKCEPDFQFNRKCIRYLHKYYLGIQPILSRSKKVRDDICNKPVENHAQEIVNFFNGYIFGRPCVYVRNGGTDTVSEDVQKLNKAMEYEGKVSSDRVLGQWMLETGLGYKIALPDKGYAGGPDEVPFVVDTIDSDMAYVVKHSGIGHKPLMGVIHIPRDNKSELIVAYTTDMYFEIDEMQIITSTPHTLGRIPLIEYELNPERMGAFEPVLSMLDSLNLLSANRFDGVEQFVQGFMKFVNCEIDEDKFDRMKERGAIAIKSTAGLPADVEVVSSELNQQQSQTLVDYTLEQICHITGMPNTKDASTGTNSDSVGAVIVRNGWNETEARAEQIESMFKKSEREFLQVILDILRISTGLDLKVSDLDIRFPRRQYENLAHKAEVFSKLLQLPIDPEIPFKYCGMFPDPQSEYESSEKYLKAAGKQWDGATPPQPVELFDTVTANRRDSI